MLLVFWPVALKTAVTPFAFFTPRYTRMSKPIPKSTPCKSVISFTPSLQMVVLHCRELRGNPGSGEGLPPQSELPRALLQGQDTALPTLPGPVLQQPNKRNVS